MAGTNLAVTSVFFVLIIALQATVFAQQGQSIPSFNQYLLTLKLEAKELGIDEAVIASSFPQIKLFRTAQDTSKMPIEAIPSLDMYIPQQVPEWKIEKSRRLYVQYQTELKSIGRQYGVQPRFIVALLGFESNVGIDSSRYPLLSVRASKAYYNQQSRHEREEFFAALKILEQGDLQAKELLGSAECLLGELQFLPSQYLAYAQDGDGDGKKEVWNNPQDVFASLANNLKLMGWKAEETWGRQVLLPTDFNDIDLASRVSKTFAQWTELGITRYDGNPLPSRDDMLVVLIMPDGPKGRAYLTYDNYRVLTKRKNSDYDSLSIAYLSEKIK